MKNNESKIQIAIVKYLRLMGYTVAAIPNGGNRNAVTGAIMKREGVLAGHSDINIYFDNTVFFIEIKTDNGRQSESQKTFEKKVKSLGYEYRIWRSIDDAIKWHEYIQSMEIFQREN